MRLIYTLLLLLIGTNAFSQSYIPFGANKVADTSRTYNALFLGAVRMPVYGNNDTNRVLTFNQQGQIIFVTKGNGGGTSIDTSYVAEMISDSLERFTDTFFNWDRAITANISGITGTTVGGKNLKKGLNNLLFPTTAPTGVLTVTVLGNTSTAPNFEKRPVGTSYPVTLNWSVTRSLTTDSISSIVVDGVPQVFISPVAGATVSGTQASTFVANTNRSWTITANTFDGKSFTLTRNGIWRSNFFFGFLSTQTPDNTQLLALSSNTNGASKSQNLTLVNNGTQRYPTLLFPESTDPSNTIQIKDGNGVDIKSNFDRTIVAFTNQFGHTENFILFIFKNTTASNLGVVTQ